MSGLDWVAGLLGFERAAAKAAPRVDERRSPVTPYVWPSWRQGQPDWTPPTLQGYAEAGYERNALVLACIRRRSESAAYAPLVAYRGQRDEPQRLDDSHPLARLLLKPNLYQSWYEFMQQAITYLDLDGNVFIYKSQIWRDVGPAGRGRLERLAQPSYPAALYLLRSDRVRVVPGNARDKPLLGYVYDADDTGNWLGREPFLPEEVLHIKYPNPRDPFEGFGRGTSPLGAAARYIDVDNAATSFLKTFFDQGVVPYGLLKSRQSLTDEEVARIRQRIREQYSGSQNWAETMILDMDAEYQRMGMNFAEMQFDVLDTRNEAGICMALDVPPILVGAKVGLDRSTYANYKEAREAFWQDSLIPGLYRLFEDAFNAGLGTDTEWLAYDYSKVPALREDESAKAAVAVSVFVNGLARLNEARGMIKLEPVPEEEDGFGKPTPGEARLQEEENRQLAQQIAAGQVPQPGGLELPAPGAPMPAAEEPAEEEEPELPKTLAEWPGLEFKAEVTGPHNAQMVDMACPLCAEVGVDVYPDHGGLCVCRSCRRTFDPAVEVVRL